MNSIPSRNSTVKLTDEERESFRADALDADRALDLAVGRDLSRELSSRSKDEYLLFLENLKIIFAEFASASRPNRKGSLDD